MESSRGKLHAKAQRQLVERKHILGVVVRHRAAEADVLQPHVLQREQCAQTLVETTLTPAQLIILPAQTLN